MKSQLPRFGGGGSGGPNSFAPYPQHLGGHASHHPSQLGGGLNPSLFNQPNAQSNPFTPNNALLGGFSGLGSSATGNSDSGLGSHAARAGFAHAANLQHAQQAAHAQHQHQQHHNMQHGHHGHGMADHLHRTQGKTRIRDVWKHNLEEEMGVIRRLIDKYPYIAMDTEFPGIVARPMGGFRGKSDYHYQCLRVNVDLLKVIQLGVAFFDEDGETPATKGDPEDIALLSGGRKVPQQQLPLAWQFNFQFNLEEDMSNGQSIQSLQQAGIDFGLLERDGIDPERFAALLLPSGLIAFEEKKWISFHGGYDFGYLTKLLSCQELANDEFAFGDRMKKYFPSIYDVKFLLKHVIRAQMKSDSPTVDAATAEILKNFELKSGLEHIAETLKIKRVGAAHQAGSDALLTGKVFFSMRDKIFHGDIPKDHVGQIWGIGAQDVATAIRTATTPAMLERTPPNNSSATGSGGTGALNGTPSTPSNHPAGMGPMTPGGGGGAFGNFSFARG